YAGIIDEHRAVRSASGVFDVGHLGRFLISGAGAADVLQRALSNDLGRLAPGQAQYSLLLNESGGIIDDLFVYRLEERSYLLVVNASNMARDRDELTDRARGVADFRLEDVTPDRAMIAVQGPAAIPLLDRLSGGVIGGLPRHGVGDAEIAGIPVLACRTGYTGEDGSELILASERAPALWDVLVENQARPCGLGARDTLRLEAAYPLHGNDIDETTNPIEAGLTWAVSFSKGWFTGREALIAVKERGPERRLAGFVMEGRGIARARYPIVAGGAEVGRVTSGSYAPTLNRNIGLGYVRADLAKAGTEIAVVIRGEPVAARVVKRPFYGNV
ncbi:MAG TPA: glycine cleavage system aminomethyltransferase GcvT, partial [Dehalococcoidia bacterium]|nr:glycine cleavage system aminomethyltransferase GcvT [Dehalococcoidia bacterium]